MKMNKRANSTVAIFVSILAIHCVSTADKIDNLKTKMENATRLSTPQSLNQTHINPYPFHFIMSPTPCTDERIVIVVHSAIQYQNRRMLLRATWLNRSMLEKTLEMKVKIVFITGMTSNQTYQDHLHYEQEMYDDIVQSDFMDCYHNNTYKAISYLRWVSSSQGCPHSLILLKVDDDALIHPLRFTKLKSKLQDILKRKQENIYLGRFMRHHVIREKWSPWYVSYEQWPHKVYPDWFQGLVYILSTKLASKLITIALETRYLFTDDVYVGILVSQVKGVQVIKDSNIGFGTRKALSAFERSFQRDGKLFYHVPNLSYFYKWYHLQTLTVI